MNSTPVPGPADERLSNFVVDKEAALRLGKALFWDTRVGSDNKTACASCHFHAGADDRGKNQSAPACSRRHDIPAARNRRLERMPMVNGEQAVYDVGYYNIGVRPTGEDLGVGGTDPFNNPLSETRMVQAGKANLLGDGFNAAQEPAVGPGQRFAVDGAFKTPGLRNVEFTGPYFHNGGRRRRRGTRDRGVREGEAGDLVNVHSRRRHQLGPGRARHRLREGGGVRSGEQEEIRLHLPAARGRQSRQHHRVQDQSGLLSLSLTLDNSGAITSAVGSIHTIPVVEPIDPALAQ